MGYTYTRTIKSSYSLHSCSLQSPTEIWDNAWGPSSQDVEVHQILEVADLSILSMFTLVWGKQTPVTLSVLALMEVIWVEADENVTKLVPHHFKVRNKKQAHKWNCSGQNTVFQWPLFVESWKNMYYSTVTHTNTYIQYTMSIQYNVHTHIETSGS